MAIDLKKEEYPNIQGQTEEPRPIREVFPTHNDPPYANGTIGEDGEIYPSREIYPQPSVKIHVDNSSAVPPQDNDILPRREDQEKDMTGRFLEPRVYIRKPLKLIIVMILIAVLTVLISFSVVYSMGQWDFWAAG
ncbi:MAG: hypothetical protein ACI4J5_05500 [Oscillospiraceae bacterium]